MKQYAGALNRGWLAVLGALGLIAGLYCVLAMLELVPGPAMGSKVNADQVSSLFDRIEVIAGIVGLGVVIGLLSIAWLLAQVPRTNEARSLRFQDDAARGLTLCDPDVVTQAVADDVRTLPSVLSADAVLRGTVAAPELILRLGVDDRTDFPDMMNAIRSRVVKNFTTALGTPPSRLGVRLDVEHGKRTTNSVTM